MGTYLLTVLGIWFNIDNLKSAILFFGGVILLSLQIYLHIIKIKKERKKDTPL
jgi:hypothetical protein